MIQPCAGPQPAAGDAGFALPVGATDCHAHVFGPYHRFPLAPERSYTPPEAPLDAFLTHLNALGLSRGVLVTASAQGTDNRQLVEALHAAPDRLRGIAVLGADVQDAEIDRLHLAGVRGIRLNFTGHGGAAGYANGTGLETLRAVGHRIAERGWHLQAWLNASDLAELAPVLEAFPLNIVIDHMGRVPARLGPDHPAFRLLCEKLRTGRYWCKLSGADRLTAEEGRPEAATPLAAALVAANPDQLVWGSDWPHVGYFGGRATPRDSDLLRLLPRWLPSNALQRRVLVENPARLYGFEAGDAE